MAVCRIKNSYLVTVPGHGLGFWSPQRPVLSCRPPPGWLQAEIDDLVGGPLAKARRVPWCAAHRTTIQTATPWDHSKLVDRKRPSCWAG